MAEDRGAVIPSAKTGCDDCEFGWRDTADKGVIPCSTCNPEAFTRWAEGSYRPSFEEKPPPRATGDTTWRGRKDVDL